MRIVRVLLLSLALFLLGWASTAQAVIPASQRQVLLDLYASTNGASWTNKTNWNGPVGTECSWHGLLCDYPPNNVIRLDLTMNNLVGTLPSLSGLTALQYVSVYGNQLTGSIPSLSGLTALQYFSVGNNQLTGSIPSLSGLTALQGFFAFSNQLTGSIPSLSGLTALQRFSVYSNQLTGPVPAAPNSLVAGGSALCGNSLVSSGNAAIDAAWDTATGTNWLACQKAVVAPADCLFKWAEGTYPTLFAPARPASITVAPWYYRYYSQTDTYLGTSSVDNHVYYKGPASNYSIVDEGALTTWLSTAGCQ